MAATETIPAAHDLKIYLSIRGGHSQQNRYSDPLRIHSDLYKPESSSPMLCYHVKYVHPDPFDELYSLAHIKCGPNQMLQLPPGLPLFPDNYDNL